MKISEMIKELKEVEAEFGDMECLIEIMTGENETDIQPVEGISITERGEYGLSSLFII